MKRPSRAVWWLAGLACLLAGLYQSRTAWLKQIGRDLVDVQEPEHVDMIVVLGGDFFGNRILKAAELVRAGFAPHVLVSGGGNIYGLHESDYAVPFAVRHGYDEKIFLKLDYPATSTADEAKAVVKELRRQGVKSYIVVTNEYHSRRAGRLFRSASPDMQVRMVACADTLHWNSWWLDREARKTFFLEWAKTITSAAGA